MRTRLALTALALAVLGGCAPPAGSLPPGASLEPVPARLLPTGFPVIGGAVRLPLPDDDPGLIAAWNAPAVGSPVYQFYLRALPAAGFGVLGAYPGDAAALIRFTAGGETWQLVLDGRAGPGTRIEVRLDRP
jgi:hypothetical protein